MPEPRIRPMTPADVEAAADAVLADDWGDRRAWFRFAVGHDRCRAVVAEADGRIVGTGVATLNGVAAWIGTIWVARSWRRRGLGRRLTDAAIEAADRSGASTHVLVASTDGQPLYEAMGFRVTGWYVILEADGRDGRPPADPEARPAVRAYREADLAAMTALDAAVTGEDRSHLLAAFAAPETTRVATGHDDIPTGFLVRPPWGGGATIAPATADGLALLEARRDAYPADRRVRAGVLAANETGLARLLASGWTEAWRAPRLERGEPLAWQPDGIWGQFNHALG